MRRLDRHALRLLLAVEFVLAISILYDVANVSTRRFYLGARISDGSRSSATEQFVIEGSRVVPLIVARDAERLAFRPEHRWPSTLRVEARPAGVARYEIHWREHDTDRVLAEGPISSASAIVTPIPARPGVVELASTGSVTWVDPRIVTDLRVAGRTRLLVLFGIAAIGIAAGRRHPGKTDARARLVRFRLVAAIAGALFTVLSLEAGLRALGDRAPATVLAERHDLGEVRKDPRWEYTPRFGRRLRANIDDLSEWQHGDIVRMGFIPSDVSDNVLHRFRFQTDAEGFRNTRTRSRIDVATLGDSFTDAMTIDAADAWPSLLERKTGLAVQNYGTAGFGPEQERRVLTDFVVARRPRTIVLAYFAGNDIFDAEAFDDYEQSGGAVRRSDPGWPIKDVVSRADTWYVVSALHAASRWASRQGPGVALAAAPIERPRSTAPIARTMGFDRGMFTANVDGHALRWAFMPPYLNTLRMSERDLSSRRGWRLTTRAIGQMRDTARTIGAELVVMFLPFKSQIYLPMLEERMRPDALSAALRYYLPDGSLDVEAMLRNRLAQNQLLSRFCADAGIRFVDMTPALEQRVRKGHNMYFPDESHLNEAGHAVVAETLGAFLR